MRNVALGLLILISLISCKLKSNGKNSVVINVDNGILIENTTVISTNTNGVVEKFIGYILTDNDKIVYSGVAKPQLKGNYKTINGKGKFAIPGLIDSHIHLANMSGMNWNHKKKHPQLVKDYYSQLPKSFLYYGYTTLIDVNNYAPDIINDFRSASVRPDIYACGQQVQVMNDFMMVTEEYSVEDMLKSPFLYDKYNNNVSIPDSVNLKSHSPKAIISNIAREQQGICVKTLYEDESSGFPLIWEQPTPGLMKDLVNEAHQEGMPILMHSPSFNGHKFGLEAGVDIFAHSMWNWYSNAEQFLDLTFTQNHKDLLLKIANKRIGYQSTFRVIYGEVDLLKGQFTSNSELENVYPRPYLNWLKTDEGNWGKQKIIRRGKMVKAINPKFYNTIKSTFNSDEEMFKGIQEVLKIRMDKVIKLLADNNANLLLATDTGAMNMSTHPPGYNGFLEMQHMATAGVSLNKIFLAATYNNAKAFHIDNLYGTITPGKIANLLLLNKDPLKDISAYNEINNVIVRGKDYARNILSAKKVMTSIELTR